MLRDFLFSLFFRHRRSAFHADLDYVRVVNIAVFRITVILAASPNKMHKHSSLRVVLVRHYLSRIIKFTSYRSSSPNPTAINVAADNANKVYVLIAIKYDGLRVFRPSNCS